MAGIAVVQGHSELPGSRPRACSFSNPLFVSALFEPIRLPAGPCNTGCVKATFIKKTKTLDLKKNCPTPTNAAAGAEITGVGGQTFQSASFTLASASQCQGGSPRFNVDTTTGFFFLGCNNVAPTTNAADRLLSPWQHSGLAPSRCSGHLRSPRQQQR